MIRYSVGFADAMRLFEKPVGWSWRCDETYSSWRRWMSWYGAVDERGKTVESHLRRTRDIAAAKAFSQIPEATWATAHDHPRWFAPSHSALRRMGMRE